jgi:hypothetical protein
MTGLDEFAASTTWNPEPARYGRTWEIRLPWDKPPLSLNYRMHRMAEVKVVRDVRQTARDLAEFVGIPPLERIVVTLHWYPGPIRNRDDENPIPTLKALCDGLVDAGVTVDDTARYQLKRMPVIHDGDGDPRLLLVVREVLDA